LKFFYKTNVYGMYTEKPIYTECIRNSWTSIFLVISYKKPAYGNDTFCTNFIYVLVNSVLIPPSNIILLFDHGFI